MVSDLPGEAEEIGKYSEIGRDSNRCGDVRDLTNDCCVKFGRLRRAGKQTLELGYRYGSCPYLRIVCESNKRLDDRGTFYTTAFADIEVSIVESAL